MEAYMYKYSCPGSWWGMYNGLRNVYSENELTDREALNLAKQDIKIRQVLRIVQQLLLVKYKLSIESVKAYPDITKFHSLSQLDYLKNRFGLEYRTKCTKSIIGCHRNHRRRRCISIL